jgi:hypothetical protein
MEHQKIVIPALYKRMKQMQEADAAKFNKNKRIIQTAYLLTEL